MTPTKDEILKQEIIDHLVWDNRVDASKVHVDVNNGKVKLEGVVPHQMAKLAAVNDAFRVAGIRNVQNFLEVKYPTDIAVPSDSEISESILKMMEWNNRLDSTGIRVKTNNGMVILSGTVESSWGKHLAEEIASSANGVVDVLNNLSVKIADKITDREIQHDIINAYKRSMLITEDRVDVEVSDGIVHVVGVVSNYLIKKEVYDIALHTAGVKEVIDEVTIG